VFSAVYLEQLYGLKLPCSRESSKDGHTLTRRHMTLLRTSCSVKHDLKASLEVDRKPDEYEVAIVEPGVDE